MPGENITHDRLIFWKEINFELYYGFADVPLGGGEQRGNEARERRESLSTR